MTSDPSEHPEASPIPPAVEAAEAAEAAAHGAEEQVPAPREDRIDAGEGMRPSADGTAYEAAPSQDFASIPGFAPGGAVTPDPAILLYEPFVGDQYDATYLYLVPRDPESILVLWEVGEATRLDLTTRFGQDFFEKNRLILRVHQVTGVDFNGFNANHIFEVDDDLHWKNNYWVKVMPDNDYVAEIGYRAHGTTFFEHIARSNVVFAPKAGPTKHEAYADWGSVSVDPNDVEVPVEANAWRFNQYRYWKARTHHAPPEKGCWALVLHQHLPFVRHPEYEVPLEEQWFYEAVVSVYTQFLNMLWRLERDKIDFRLTVSLTPSLLSMMQDPLLQQRSARHIEECIKLATRERDNAAGRPWHGAIEQTLHRFWIAKEVFEAYGGDLTRGYRDFQDLGKLEVITCPATHMILPLYKHMPEVVRAQLQIACRQYERVFGRWPRGMWLPENAFTPGLDALVAAEGIRWVLVSAKSIRQGDTRPFYGTSRPVVTPSGLACFGIDEETRDQVWSREAGYPGHPDYKEWYRDLGYDADWDYLTDYWKVAQVRRNTGIKYFRITQKGLDLGQKDYYNPAWARETLHAQAGQFVYYRGAQANHWRGLHHDSVPCIVSAYDAELFGHWWEEGPEWIESVFRKMLYDQCEVRPVTPSEYLAEHPRQQRMNPGAASWGKKDYFGTWVDGRAYQPNCWTWRHYFRICQRMIGLATARRAETDPLALRALDQAAREVFLACASDWSFLIETGQAVRYSELQIIKHLDRAKVLMDQIEQGRIEPVYLATLERADTIFHDDMDYRVFCRE